MNGGALLDIIVHPLGVADQHSDAAVGSPAAQLVIGLNVQLPSVGFGISHAVEGDILIDARPVLRVATPLGEIAPAGPAAVSDPVAQIAVPALHAGRADHLPLQHGILIIFIQRVHLRDLIGHIHHHIIGRQRRLGAGPGRGVHVHHVARVEELVPGLLVHIRVDGQAVILLKFLHGGDGLIHIIAADGAVEEAQFFQSGLDFLDVLALGAPGHALGKGNVFPAVLGAFAVAHDDHVVNIARVGHGVGGRRRGNALGQRRFAEQALLGIQIGDACHVQPVLFLKVFHRALGSGAEFTRGLRVQIAQIDQPLLQAGDLVAVVAIFQHPVLSRQEQLPGLLIQFAGDLQPVILLQAFKAIPGSFQKIAGNFSVIIPQLGQALLNVADQFAGRAVFQRLKCRDGGI